jgi:hypothetical protein
MAFRRCALALTLAALAACGSNDDEKRAVDDAEAACLALPRNGGTVGTAARDVGTRVTGAVCIPAPTPIAGGSCQPTSGNPECSVFFELLTPNYCGPQGCCHFCEVHVLEATAIPDVLAAPVCAATFFRKQPCQ